MPKSAPLLLVLFGASLPAQNIINVPVGAEVGPYVAQANPGDILQLGAWHPGFVLDKGVVVRGAAGGTTIGTWWFDNFLSMTIPAGERAHLSGLTMPEFSDGSSSYGSSLTLQSGEATVEDLVIEGTVQVQGGVLVVQRMQHSAGRVRIQGGTCSITDSTVQGFHAYVDVAGSFSSSPGIVQQSGTLVLSQVDVGGGAGSFVGDSPSPGVSCNGGRCYATDCSFSGGFDMFGFNAPSILAAASATAELARTALSDPGQASTGYTIVPEMVGMVASAAPTRGASFDGIATAGSSQEVLVILGGFGIAPIDLSPFVAEPVFGDVPNLAIVTAALPAAGAQVVATVTVPNTPSLQGADVWLQAVQFAGAELRASALVGGAIR